MSEDLIDELDDIPKPEPEPPTIEEGLDEIDSSASAEDLLDEFAESAHEAVDSATVAEAEDLLADFDEADETDSSSVPLFGLDGIEIVEREIEPCDCGPQISHHTGGNYHEKSITFRFEGVKYVYETTTRKRFAGDETVLIRDEEGQLAIDRPPWLAPAEQRLWKLNDGDQLHVVGPVAEVTDDE
jgi:hypothetical protein